MRLHQSLSCLGNIRGFWIFLQLKICSAKNEDNNSNFYVHVCHSGSTLWETNWGALSTIFSLEHPAAKGLRGIISYTYDESFEGAKLYGQELSLKAFDKLLSAKDFGNEPKLLSSTYSIFGLLDGKCDVKMECCKNCGSTCSVPKEPKVPAFLTTPPVIEHPTKPAGRKTPATRKVTSPPRTEPTPRVVVEITPKIEVTTEVSATTPTTTRKPTEARKVKTRPTVNVPEKPQVKVPETNLLTPLMPEENPGRVNRMINHPSTKKPFRGPPYIPQPEQVTERVDHTWKTYAHRDVTFHHHTWQPFIATGTWNPNTVSFTDGMAKDHFWLLLQSTGNLRYRHCGAKICRTQ